LEEVEESVIAKSTGEQEEEDTAPQDAALFHHLATRKKISKEEANYKKQEMLSQDGQQSCVKCKFNLPDEKKCHIVDGEIDNEYGISKFFSPKGDGMLPGDMVWDFIKKTEKKLRYEEGYVIPKGAEGFQCKDCKYYMYSGSCLLIKGNFK
jgi:mannose-6-phosphate isomerase-like protein (cupin superfamily)